MKRLISFLIIATALLGLACKLTAGGTENAITATPTEQPATETAPPTQTSPPPTDTPTALPPVPVVYYYFVSIESHTYPAGSVVILPDILILGPTLSEIARSPDPVTNIRSALQAMLNDPRNQWSSTGVGITSITFDEGAATVALEGEYFAAGGIVLIAAREQILLTVFAEASVQTATITLNGKNIANLGISHSSEARPDNYAFTRDEIETFLAENAYQGSVGEGQETLPALNLQGIWQNNRSMAAGWADRYHFYPSGAFHFYPNEMVCIEEKIEKIGTWEVEDSTLTLRTTRQVIKRYEVSTSGLCHLLNKQEVGLPEPGIEQLTIVDLGTQEGDLYPSISINDQLFWKFSEDASSYGDEKFPEIEN